MKRVMLMVMLGLVARITGAGAVEIEDLAGEYWYGLYLNGQKSGWSVSTIEVDGDGRVTLVENAVIRVSMVGNQQDMAFASTRVYDSAGRLERITSSVMDPSGRSTFECVVDGDVLRYQSVVGGASTEEALPRPSDSLDDILKQRRLAGPEASVGDELKFSYFEPLYKQEMSGASRIVGQEERMFDGALTQVFVIKTVVDTLNLETISYVTDDGTLLEDVTAGFITMRLEPKQMAQDVTYSNDVTVANAIILDEPIPNARNLDSLRLTLSGPLTNEHIYNDERQHMVQDGDHYDFVSHAISLDGFTAATLPITDEELQEWLKPTMFVQSDDDRLRDKAREIIGDETDAAAISELLCRWVYNNVAKRYSARLTNALEVLENLEGDCTEHSILFIGLARAAGLPAREVAGLVYVDDPRPGFFFHQWAKVWVGKWIDVDPTFNQPLADVTHIKLSEGDLIAQSRLIPIIGRIGIDVTGDEAVAGAYEASD